MTTPVLSKKQQKKSLSGKKTPAKGLRNVLAQPYGFSWPILRDDNVNELKILLESSMPAVKRSSPDISWAQLHRMNKTERQVARKEARLKQGVISPDETILNSIVMGVNEVTRLLEKNDASCVLLEANVEPMLLIKHIVSMADLKNVSVILVPFLKNVMLEIVGFASAALALKKIVAETEDHHFYNLYKKVVELCANFERTKPLKLDFKEDSKESLILKESGIIVPEKSCDKEKKLETNKLFSLSTDVYKYRNSRKERIFIPENAGGSEIVTERLDDGDFISIGKDSTDFTVKDFRDMKNNKRKTRRYVDIHDEDTKNFLETKDDSMQLDEYVTLDPNSNSDRVDNSGESEILYEKKSTVLGIGDESSSINNKMIRENEKRNNKNFKYESLKVKRLQGNSNRVKATKDPKRNKK